MKKGIKKIITAGLILASSAGLVACAETEEELKYDIIGEKEVYVVYDTFTIEGAKLRIEQKDGTFKEVYISNDMIKKMPDMTTAGMKTIVVVYEGNEYEFVIEVEKANVLSYNFTGYKESYFTSEIFSTNGIQLNILYDNNHYETVNVTPSMLTTMPSLTTAGTKTVTINYDGKPYQFDISVVSPVVTYSAISGYKSSYFTSETFSTNGLNLHLEYNDGNQKDVPIIASMIEEEPDMTVAGNKTITVNYGGQQYYFTIKVVAVEEDSYEITGYKKSYFTNDTFSLDNLNLHINYNDGSEEDVKITSTMIQHMPTMSTAGTKTIIVNYNGEQYEFSISVVAPSQTDFAVTGYESSYFTNDTFETDDIKLVIYYNNNTSHQITVSSNMIESMPDMTVEGSKTVTINYNGKKYEFTIIVVEPKLTSAQIIGNEELYDINTEIDYTNIKLRLYFENDTHKDIDVDASMLVEAVDMTTEGFKIATISYKSVQYSFNFEVKDLAKAEMMEKIQNFMNDYNSEDVKTSGMKINVEGLAKYLGENVEFNEELYNITMSSFNNLEGYKIYQPDDEAPYVLIKEFDTMEELINNTYTFINLVGVNYHVFDMYNGTVQRSYGTSNSYIINEDMPEISLDEFMADALQITQQYSKEGKDITVFDSRLAGPIYKAITNAIVNATMDIKKDDIISARDNLTAQLDIIKTLQNINTNVTNIDFYDIFVNEILFKEEDKTYIDLARNYITEIFEITDQNTLNKLDYVLDKDIEKIRNNQLQDLETTYNMIVELNDTLQISNGNPSLLEKLDIIVSGIDNQDKHMLSKFVYSCKDFARVYTYTYGETANRLEAGSGYRWIYGGYWDVDTYIYQYRDEISVDNEAELVEEYYAGLKSLVERVENIADYTNVKTFAYDIIADMRAMDQVVQVLEENGYISEAINFNITSSVRTAVESYIEMYEANMIADVLDMLGQAMPEGAKQYEVLSDSMAPELRPGDKITVEAQESYKVGDIVVFNVYDTKIVHRVIGVIEDDGKTYYICHGDNVPSVNPSNDGYVDWQEDAEYVRNLIINNSTISEIQEICSYINIVEESDVEGVVTAVNQMYLAIPANLVEALKDCSDIIYSAFNKSEIDYIKLIEDICDRLELEKDYYIEKYNAGELTIFADVFDRFIGELSNYEGAELEFFTALKASCNYLDSVLVQGTDRTELMNEIHKAVKALYDVYAEIGEDAAYEQMITDVIVRLTNTDQDFYTNFKEILTEYQEITKEFATMMLSQGLNIDQENTQAIEELKSVVNKHQQAYISDEFVVGNLISDLNDYIDEYCDEETKVVAKSSAVLGVILMGQEKDVDYNEWFAGVELPPEIESVDFNKLIKETLRDQETYDILSLNDVKVDYITDEHGNIVKEVLTVSLKANYDIILTSLDANVTLTIEINF